jgi:hypothetical protein
VTRARRRLTAVALVAALAVPAAWGRPPHRSGLASSPGLASVLLSFFGSWGRLALPGAWLKEGCKVDPFGRCLPSVMTNDGCKLDPFGRCAESTTSKAGCMVDPNGVCLPGH